MQHTLVHIVDFDETYPPVNDGELLFEAHPERATPRSTHTFIVVAPTHCQVYRQWTFPGPPGRNPPQDDAEELAYGTRYPDLPTAIQNL
jgi:hypothetical protein